MSYLGVRVVRRLELELGDAKTTEELFNNTDEIAQCGMLVDDEALFAKQRKQNKKNEQQ
jgi:hypothetical protein